MTQASKLALISVSDKTGVIELAKALVASGYGLVSTGGTAQMLRDSGFSLRDVADLTGFPEMLDGRVKTLHPNVHAGLLARRDLPSHVSTIAQHGIAAIDLLCVNLYPFEATVARADCTFEEAIENIDIGGPAMVRSAAKNWSDVAVLTSPAQYPEVIDALRSAQGITKALRFKLAVAAFNRISDYDGAISNYLSSLNADGTRQPFPAQLNLRYSKLQDLRYGENPHQQAAFYQEASPKPGSLVAARQHQGKELSFNNIADADAAWECVKSFEQCACVIVKHANPCGVALGIGPAQAYAAAFATDPTSAFGGIIALNREVDEACALAISKQFVEVLIAPGYTPQALAVFASKANTRVLQIEFVPDQKNASRNTLDLKRVGSGLLVQDADNLELVSEQLRCVTRAQPSAEQWNDLQFAWRVAHYVKSNAIVFCKAGATLGVGAGQMSRIDSARIAGIKAQNANLSLAGSVVASDAFFPFRDGLDAVADAGAVAVIQPGGSVRDQEVIDAANERNMVMLFTGTRHFRH
jgi:phosphoribosylaminoimidazolecarboxamide formyltransferase/IMP cyclohydrolase